MMFRQLRVRAASVRSISRLLGDAEDFDAALAAQEAEDLGRVGVHADGERIGAALPPPGDPSGVYRSEPSAQELFQAAGAESRRARRTFVGAHVLAAAADLERGPTARALRRMGVDRTALREAALAEIEAQERL